MHSTTSYEPDLATLHEAIAERLSDEPCVIVGDRVRSWREVTDRTRRLANVLRAAGLGGNPPVGTDSTSTGQDHLGILLHNGAEYLEALLGAAKASVAPFNVNYRYTADELLALFLDARPAALVYGASFTTLVAEVLDRWTGAVPLLIQVDDRPGETSAAPAGALDYEEILAAAAPAEYHPTANDRHLLYTGGTTGTPKGVIWRVGDMLAGPYRVRPPAGEAFAGAEAAAEQIVRGRRGRVLPGAPLMHGAGMGVALGGWLGGSTVVFPDRPDTFDAGRFWDAVDRHRVSLALIVGDAFGAPLLTALEDRETRHVDDRDGWQLSSLKTLVSSGAPLRTELKERFARHLPCVRVTDFIGSSEGMKAHLDEGVIKAGVAVLSEDRTRELAPGSAERGWLAATGHIPIGYLNAPEATASTFVTIGDRRYSVGGDMARIGKDGSVAFLGREATTINTGGEKVYAEEVEQALRAEAAVRDAVVVGRPSERWGSEVVAIVAATDPETPLDEEQLRSDLRVGLAGYKIPKVFVLVPEVRRHASGKPDYRWAKDLATGVGRSTA